MIRYIYLFNLLCLFFPPSISYAGKPVVQVVNTMQRIFSDTQINNDPQNKISMWLAKNEYHSAQVAIQVNRIVDLKSVSISDMLDSATNTKFASDNCEVRLPEYVHVQWNTRATPHSELDGKAPGMYPDPLPEFKPIKFKGNRSVWLTCHVPDNSLSGSYQGKLNIVIDDDVYEIPLELNVWDFALPEKSSLYVSNWLHVSQLIKHYNVRKYSGRFWELIEIFAKDMSQHRLNVIFTRLNLIQVTQTKDHVLSFDFTHYEKWVKIFRKYGFKAIEAGPLLHPKSFTIFSANDRNKIHFKTKNEVKKFLDSDNGKEFLVHFLKALHQKNAQLGIGDMYLQHVGDEAKSEERTLYLELASMVRKYMPGVAIIDATHLKANERVDMMDLPVTNMYAEEVRDVDSNVKSWGKWWFTAAYRPRGMMPNRFIDYPLIKMRILPWLNWRYGMSGYLHYAYNWWQLPSNASPWDQTQHGNYAAGDAWLVYPPKNKELKKPVSSLRLEVFRDGIEDYEYFVLLKDTVSDMRILLNAVSKGIDKKSIELAIEQGQNLLDLISSEVRSKTEYPRQPSRVDVIRDKVGSWLNDNVRYTEIEKHNISMSVF